MVAKFVDDVMDKDYFRSLSFFFFFFFFLSEIIKKRPQKIHIYLKK